MAHSSVLAQPVPIAVEVARLCLTVYGPFRRINYFVDIALLWCDWTISTNGGGRYHLAENGTWPQAKLGVSDWIPEL